MWPLLKSPAEEYFGETPTALLHEGLGWGKLFAKPRATDLPTANQERTGGAMPALQELSHFHMQSALRGNRISVKGDL